MIKVTATRAKARTPAIPEWTGNHHRFVVKPRANLGTRTAKGIMIMVTIPPMTMWAITARRLGPSVLAVSDVPD